MDQELPTSTAASQPVPQPLLPINDLISSSFVITKNRIWRFAAITFLPWLVLIPIYAALLFFLTQSHLVTFQQQPTPNELFPLLGLIGFSMVLFGVVMSMIELALLYDVKSLEQNLPLPALYRHAFKRMLPFWGTMILFGLIIFGGYLLFFIPGIIFALWFNQSLYIFIDEDIAGWAALKRSKQLMSGIMLRVLGRIIIAAIIAGFGTQIIIYVLAIFHNIVLTLVGYMLVYFVSTMFQMVYYYQLFRSIRTYKSQAVLPPSEPGPPWWVWVLVGLGIAVIPLTILALIILVATNPLARLQSIRDVQRQENIMTLQNALASYHSTNGIYPQSLSNLATDGELATIPKDPLENTPHNHVVYAYQYTVLENGQSYQLCAQYEHLYMGNRTCVGPDGPQVSTTPSPIPVKTATISGKMVINHLATPSSTHRVSNVSPTPNVY